MQKITRKESKSLQPATGLWALYRPEAAPHAFRAASRRDALAWQKKARRALASCLGLDALTRVPPRPRLLEETQKNGYVRQKLLIRTGPQTCMPVYLLLPEGRPRPLPVVLALHGHGYGVKDIVGLWEDGGERDTADGYQKDFAVSLCRAGFAVAAPEISCFGERQSDFSYLKQGQGATSTCVHTAALAAHLGLSAAGLRVHDGLRLVDYLQTRRDLDVRRLGAMGISGGGMHTFFSAGVDPRIRACVISGYYSTFRASILAMHHCPCNFVPGLAAFGEMYDLIGLVAPRPVLVEAGTRDPIFPIEAVRPSVARARAVYKVFGAPGEVETDYFEGRHSISGARAYAFLSERLGEPQA